MHLTDLCEFDHALTSAPADTRRQDFDMGYEDEESFARIRARQPQHPSREQALAHRRASALDDDEVADIALHFGDR